MAIDELTRSDGDGLRDQVYDYYKAPALLAVAARRPS